MYAAFIEIAQCLLEESIQSLEPAAQLADQQTGHACDSSYIADYEIKKHALSALSITVRRQCSLVNP